MGLNMKKQQITLTLLLTAISLTSPTIAMKFPGWFIMDNIMEYRECLRRLIMDNIIKHNDSPLLSPMPNETLQPTLLKNINSFSLQTLPDKMLEPILLKNINTITPLEDGIKTALQLSKTCTRFNVLLTPKAVGQACRHYSQNEKDATLKTLLCTINNITYWNKRRAASMLIYAGADNAASQTDPLLRTAVYRNDEAMIAALFENGANPNQTTDLGPTFFDIQTAAIAEIFRYQGVDFHAKHLPSYSNVLWYIISCNWAPQIMPFYLQHGVNAKELNSYGNNNCLLHKIADSSWVIFNRKQLAELLLNAAPEMVNTLNANGQTPTDMAIASREKYRNMTDSFEQQYFYEFLHLITLFEKHGGKTAQQLKNQQSMAREKEAVGDCIICFENNDNMMAIPCPNKHYDRICLICYNSSLQFSENCPLCRTPLQ